MTSAPMIYRHEVPVNDQWYTVELTGLVLHVAARRPDRVEFWTVQHDGERPWPTPMRVFGTGQPISRLGSGAGAVVHVGTALVVPMVALGIDPGLVWHLVAHATTGHPLASRPRIA